MVGGGGCIARADVHDDGPAADTAAVRRQIATKVNAACNPRIIAAIAFVGHERSERPSDTRAVLFAHRRRAARDETSSSNDRRPSGRGGSPCEVCDTETHPCWQCAAYRASRATQAVCIQAAARGSRLLIAPRAGGSRAADSPQKRGSGMARSGSARGVRRGSRRHVVYGGWHNKRWIYAVWAKPPFDPYSPPWPPPTPTRVRWRRAVRQAARRRCV